MVKYPRLKYLLLGQDKEHHFIADYGHYKGHKVTLVGIEVQTTFESEDFFEEDIRHVLKIEATGESDKEGSLEEIEGDKFVMYMHKYEWLTIVTIFILVYAHSLRRLKQGKMIIMSAMGK